jgi:Fe-S-cluster-containing hydrogenase component 2/CRP-like cAMP-binding protein
MKKTRRVDLATLFHPSSFILHPSEQGGHRMAEPFEVRIPFVAGREEEALFARDDSDMLIRREQETRARFQELVTITIDGFPVEVPRAVPKTDAQGNPIRGADGELIPRTTTIYDAAARLVTARVWSELDLKARIPILCHQPHLAPVGMCRICSVHISSRKRGKLWPGRRLVPACQHRVETDMVVTTRAGVDGYNPETWKQADLEMVDRFAQDVHNAVRVLAEFLVADHLRPSLTPVKRYENELASVARTLGVTTPRPWIAAPVAEDYSRNTLHYDDAASRRLALPLTPTPITPEDLLDPAAQQAWVDWNHEVDQRFPYSSRSFVVDHDRCILCDRCTRACSEVKPFNVLGHTGIGYQTRISFDLDATMRESDCVQCGECMIACPTGAISLRRRVQPRSWPDSPRQIPQNPNTPFPSGSSFLTADEMLDVWLAYVSPTRGPRVVFPFRSIPYAYLKWNEGAVRKWVIREGEQLVLYREGDYGSTAFLLQGIGLFHFFSGGRPAARHAPGWFERLLGRTSAAEDASTLGQWEITRPGNQLIMGEMACLTHQPRNATVVAEVDPTQPALELVTDAYGWPAARLVADVPPTVVVYEITRNLLDMMQRAASPGEDLEEVYTTRAVEACVKSGAMCAGLADETRQQVATFLLQSGRLEFRRVAPSQTILAEGEPGHDLYIIRLGTVRVFRTIAGRERVIDKRSPGDYFGLTALLADELRWRGLLTRSAGPTGRVASVAALDPVEVVRVPGELFEELCEHFPDLRERLLEEAARRLSACTYGSPAGVLGAYVHQGLFQAQQLLALDLTCCTRCDECTRACADSHDGHSRLLRDGLRFGDFLIATTCRSCHMPYCMEGCPVDAIHRREGHLAVVIENHCIGCGLCEKNCPYGAIQMVTRPGIGMAPSSGALVAVPRQAINCDLCNGGAPYCVAACPHDAAFRIDGPALLDEVVTRMKRVEQPG